MEMRHIPIIIDRVEDGVATLTASVPAERLPENAREGDVLFLDDGGALQIDDNETLRRRKSSFGLFKGLLEDE